MADFNASLRRKEDVPEDVRRRALYRCYAFILSLPDPQEKQEEPGDLHGEAASLNDETPAVADVIAPDNPSDNRPTLHIQPKVQTRR